jgi:hypothetical protein
MNLQTMRSERFAYAMKSLGQALSKLNKLQKEKVVEAIKKTQVFSYEDYGDLVDFLAQLQALNLNSSDLDYSINTLKLATLDMVLFDSATDAYKRTAGVSIWLPSDSQTLGVFWDKYQSLEFNKVTQWGEALKSILQN